MFAPVVLIVRDGWGYSLDKTGNAIAHAHIPNDMYYRKHYPTTLLDCSGNAVGLPKGTQGGSEVGHLTMGAGRIVWQPLEMINKAIYDKSFYSNHVFLAAIEHCKKNDSALHLMGLFSDVGVHATTEHLYALLELAKQHRLTKVYIHAFLDGRDVPEKSAHTYLIKTNKKIREIGVGKIATLTGRYYAMDRDKNWDRTQKAFDLLVEGKGFKAYSPEEAILDAYLRGDKTDYYIQPTVIVENNEPVGLIKDHDSVIFYNFRSDRTRQITSLLTGKKTPYKIDKPTIHFVCFSDYDKEFRLPVAFPQIAVTHNIGYCVSKAGFRQLRIAETEKYAHVTFFFNSQIEEPFAKEERILVASPKVPSYDLKPEMSAHDVTTKVLAALDDTNYGFVLINFANPDLVGHSGNFKATVACCEIVDECVGRIVSAVLKKQGVVLLTADHGNAEQMLYANGEPCPSHTINKVPFTLISNHITHALRDDGGLQDIGPTVLKLLEIQKPVVMTGESLI
ncbi:MAG: 2,3-bisphosphoglycerate-independent phosphoglycerate mutase [Candidatus Woesearchaeota archaeon]|jgi:2,3-bisphosphoglycerate-independent phosphoglycerate mutase